MLKSYCYTLNWVVKSPLHIGAGTIELKTGAGQDKEGSYEVADFVTDCDNKPWIPGSTLKGSIRSLCDPDTAGRLFGKPHEVGTSANGGSVKVTPAWMVGLLRQKDVARTKIETGTGVSEATKLFHYSAVLEGTKFKSTIIFTPTPFSDPEDKQNLEALLAYFCTPEGRAIGANKSDNDGRISLDHWTCEERNFTANGWESSPPIKMNAKIPSHPDPLLKSIKLTCIGPFMSKDTDDDSNVKWSLRDVNDKHPRIPTSSVAGVLRSRAEWILALDRLRDPTAPIYCNR